VSFSTPHDTALAGNGTKLFLGSQAYTVTNIVISNTNPGGAGDALIDVAHLGENLLPVSRRLW
jgi:hypothetical protein